jgi:hypothetical protein
MRMLLAAVTRGDLGSEKEVLPLNAIGLAIRLQNYV